MPLKLQVFRSYHIRCPPRRFNEDPIYALKIWRYAKEEDEGERPHVLLIAGGRNYEIINSMLQKVFLYLVTLKGDYTLEYDIFKKMYIVQSILN